MTKPYSLALVDDHVVVRSGARFDGEDLALQRRLLAELDDLLRLTGVRGVVIDPRDATPPASNAARDLVWEWFASAAHHDGVAVLTGHELAVVEANMRARAVRAPVKAFTTLDDALVWLRAQSGRAQKNRRHSGQASPRRPS